MMKLGEGNDRSATFEEITRFIRQEKMVILFFGRQQRKPHTEFEDGSRILILSDRKHDMRVTNTINIYLRLWKEFCQPGNFTVTLNQKRNFCFGEKDKAHYPENVLRDK